ncbi:unnamed protein product [Calypogeia fissa]
MASYAGVIVGAARCFQPVGVLVPEQAQTKNFKLSRECCLGLGHGLGQRRFRPFEFKLEHHHSWLRSLSYRPSSYCSQQKLSWTRSSRKPRTSITESGWQAEGISDGTSMGELVVQSSSVAAPRTSFNVLSGQPAPLGVSKQSDSVNFALFSEHATAVTLCLYFDLSENEPTAEISLDPQKNRTGNVWHIGVEDIPFEGVRYGYRVDGPQGWEKGHRFDNSKVLLDPYAKFVEGRRIFGDASQNDAAYLGTYDFTPDQFDWGDEYKLPAIPEKDLVIYEMNVRAFTADESSGVNAGIKGGYLGFIEKIPHLVELGVNAVELLPIHEFDEFEFQRFKNPRDHMINTWGYSTINFFAPMSRYGSNGAGSIKAATELKEMVKALHNAGIEACFSVFALTSLKKKLFSDGFKFVIFCWQVSLLVRLSCFAL